MSVQTSNLPHLRSLKQGTEAGRARAWGPPAQLLPGVAGEAGGKVGAVVAADADALPDAQAERAAQHAHKAAELPDLVRVGAPQAPEGLAVLAPHVQCVHCPGPPAPRHPRTQAPPHPPRASKVGDSAWLRAGDIYSLRCTSSSRPGSRIAGRLKGLLWTHARLRTHIGQIQRIRQQVIHMKSWFPVELPSYSLEYPCGLWMGVMDNIG